MRTKVRPFAKIDSGQTQGNLKRGWTFFPQRNYVGEELGNYYHQIYNSSTLAAEAMGSRVVEMADDSMALNR